MTSASLGAASLSDHSGDLGRASTSNAPSPTAVSSHLTPAPDSLQPLSAQSATHSRSMTADAPTPSDQPNSNGPDANASGTYGTRSRGRPGRARPNYADSNELDLEIEAAGKVQKGNKKSLTSSVTPVPMQPTDPPVTRNGFSAVNDTPTPNPEPPAALPAALPMTNGNSTAPSATNSSSKKRKQPGSNTTVSPAHAPQPPPSKPRSTAQSRSQFNESSMMTFSKSRARLNDGGQLIADDGTTIEANDHLYFVCEPPGEPYYFGRIMEFLHENNNPTKPVEAVRVNWFYRPKDIQRRVQDTRVVFASMHSDTCPLTAMRGKCYIEHSATIPDIDEFRKQPDSFWFNQLYDRYMHRYYEVIPTSKVVNVPRHVKKVLDERWKFVLVEVGRTKDLTSASKICKRCTDFAANHNSVDCSTCKNTYHMSCVRPPLPKKPARGFGWVCAACSRAADLKMEARNTPLSETELSRHTEADGFDDEDGESAPQDQTTRENSTGAEGHPPPTAAQLAQASLWPWRYFGIHSKPEDALDYDDRIYPRASSRLGPRHQANTTIWHGRPIEFIKPIEGKKKYKPASSAKKDAKTTALQDSDRRPKRPKWVFDEPPGFVPRGSDEPVELKGKKEHTAQLTFKMPELGDLGERGLDDDERPVDFAETVDAFLQRCDREIAPLYHLGAGSVDVRTKGLEKLQENGYDVEKALEAMRHLSARNDLKQPELSKEEIKRFEEGVSKYGSELHAVARHVSANIKESRIVRFYYTWKKTPRGRDIWGNFENRKSKKDSKRVEKDTNGTRLLEDVGDDADDSAYDNEKAASVKRGFYCKFCKTSSSRVWRRAPQTAPGTLVPRGDPAAKTSKDKSSWLVLALCGKCAYLWRRYAVQYESIEEIGKKIAIAGGRASKRKVDEELMRIVLEAQNFTGDTITTNTAQIAKTAGIEVPTTMIENEEPPKKKSKGEIPPITEILVEKKKIVPEKPIELEPLKPEMPRVKEHPCAVCRIINHPEHKILKCRDCRLHVHAPCYGVNPPVGTGPWFCDMCRNDHNTFVSTNYECVLCPVRRTPQELMEPPKVSHKKKTEREREKERAEREMVQEAGKRWREEQLAAGRPVDPREPLKRTAWNNWMHVNCAVWTKEIKFGDAEHLDNAEGMGFITEDRLKVSCKFCTDTGYPTVSCQFPSCNNTFHVGCAHQKGCILGFDISPVKMSRRETVPVLKLDQESGLAVPGVWCSHHAIPTIVHNLLETTPSGMTALQEFVSTYKQVDNTVTGTVRRAAQYQNNTSSTTGTGPLSHRRTSTINGHIQPQGQGDTTMGGNLRSSPSPVSPQINGDEQNQTTSSNRQAAREMVKSEKKCCSCLATTTPKWWPVKADAAVKTSSPALESQSLRHPSESLPPGSEPVRQTMSPEMHRRSLALSHSLIKAEPMEVDTLKVPEEVRYQCHKCHVTKKTPPASPSQIRRTEPDVIEPVPEASLPTSVYPPAAPPVGVPVGYVPPEGPAHVQPPVHGAIPPPQHWQTARPPWPPGPSAPPPQMANGLHPGPPGPPPPVAYGAPAPIYHAPRPPGEFGYPYPAPVHYGVPASLPPPGPRSHHNGIHQHSPPPPAGYPYPVSGQGPPPGQPGSPHVLPAHGVGAAPGPYMHPPSEPNSGPYGLGRGYPGPPPSGPSRISSGVSIGQITQSEAASRRQSIGGESVSTPRMGMRLPSYSGTGTAETPIDLDGPASHGGSSDVTAARRGSTAGPGASASPSVRNLLI